MPIAIASQPGWMTSSVARSAVPTSGTTAPVRRLIGNQTLPCLTIPHMHATIAIATPPTSPPTTPERYGCTSAGKSGLSTFSPSPAIA